MPTLRTIRKPPTAGLSAEDTRASQGKTTHGGQIAMTAVFHATSFAKPMCLIYRYVRTVPIALHRIVVQIRVVPRRTASFRFFLSRAHRGARRPADQKNNTDHEARNKPLIRII